MRALGIDLAERHSAAVIVEGGVAVAEFALDAGEMDVPWVQRLRRLSIWWHEILAEIARDDLDEKALAETRVVVEDIHPFAIRTKPGLRFQGALMMLMVQYAVPFEFVWSKTWQKDLGYFREEHGNPKTWARQRSEELGYTLPKWAHGKAREDLRDAFLIATWALTVNPELPTLEMRSGPSSPEAGPPTGDRRDEAASPAEAAGRAERPSPSVGRSVSGVV